MTITTMSWVLLAMGLIPWRVDWRHSANSNRKQSQRSLTIQAAFWQVKVETGPQGRRWQLKLPLIARLKGAIWSALRQLIKR